MSLEYRIGDVFDRLAQIPDGTIDLIVTSPPFLALRSYLPDDHPDKHKEIGSEPTPAEFIDTLLALSAEWGRVLAPHGSLCVELGDTFAGGNGWAMPDAKSPNRDDEGLTVRGKKPSGNGWPLAKSLTGIPTLYPWSLAYGRNLLTGNESPAGQWRIRNMIVWARPNPPVGALGDKFRPATSYITVACKGAKRYFDLDAVRTEHDPNHQRQKKGTTALGEVQHKHAANPMRNDGPTTYNSGNPAGAPPLDWHADDHPEDGDWLWKLSTQPYSGKIPTDRWVPIDRSEAEAAGVRAGDIRRTASPDCPKHGDLPGQVPSALRGERAAGSSTRNGRNGSRRDGEPLPGFAPTGPSDEHSIAQREPDPACDPAATARSTSSHRTGHDPATSPAGTPSARTTADTDDTSTSPESSAPDHDIDESSTSLAGSAGSPDTRTTRDTAGTPTPDEIPCTCSFSKRTTEYTSHYATYPLTLPKRLIEAMCPLRVCRVCGTPSTRIVDSVREVTQPQRASQAARSNDPGFGQEGHTTYTTLGWTDCGHDDWRTGIVLDPFAGSGTTLEAAQAVGRHAIGIDLDARNADLAQQRVGMFLDIDRPAA